MIFEFYISVSAGNRYIYLKVSFIYTRILKNVKRRWFLWLRKFIVFKEFLYVIFIEGIL